MNKLLTAATALALVSGSAFAEITISGSAELAMDYMSEPCGAQVVNCDQSKHSFNHDFNVHFAGTGTTDGGLTFGASGGFDNESLDGSNISEGTVFISSEFGKITLGDNSSADKLSGGIADVGLNGIGVDDVAEDIYGTTDNQVRYDHSVGKITLAVSAGTGKAVKGVANSFVSGAASTVGSFETKKNSYAVGMSFSASGATVGFGYDSFKAISAGFGYSTGQISTNAFYAKRDQSYMHNGADGEVGGSNNAADGMFDAGMTSMGVDLSYTMGASTMTLAYAKTNVSNIQPIWTVSGNDTVISYASASFRGIGVGFSHDLGGGASLVAGFGQVPTMEVAKLGMAEIGQVFDGADSGVDITAADRKELGGDQNKASVGLSLSF